MPTGKQIQEVIDTVRDMTGEKTTPLDVIEVLHGIDVRRQIQDDVERDIARKKIEVLDTILQQHYGIKPTEQVYAQRVTRIHKKSMFLPEQYYLDFKLPTGPGLPIAAFNVTYQKGLGGAPEISIQFATPNDKLIKIT